VSGACGTQRPARRLALLLPDLAIGGAERVTVHLANGLAERGEHVDMVVLQDCGGFRSELSEQVRMVDLGTRRVSRSVWPLRQYLRREAPAALISALDHTNVAAILAARLAGGHSRVIGAVHVTHSKNAAVNRTLHGAAVRFAIRRMYPRADALVAVSQGAADDMARMTGVDPRLIRVIYNPVITAQLPRLAGEAIEHPWFVPGGPPVIVAVGNLRAPKDYPTLLRAFSLLRREHDCRLLILGEGDQRRRLQEIIATEGLGQCVSLPGFVKNPYAYLGRAAVFVLSSAWEALPTVLIEALALHVPVVATDCRNGPREILHGGQHGYLAPVGDPPALAAALAKALHDPRPPVADEVLQPYTVPYAVEQYCRLIAEVLGE
jgi:glycosyltransferase involved in cell wall biosynthesis